MWKVVKKGHTVWCILFVAQSFEDFDGLNGGPSGTRTPDQPVMSRLL